MDGTDITINKVFISYSWDSAEHKENIYQLSNRLRANGIDSNIDQYYPFPKQGWPKLMAQQIDEADYVLVICTEIYRNRCEGLEEIGKGRGVKWESLLALDELYHADSLNEKFIPVILDSANRDHVPKSLRSFTLFNVSETEGYESLYSYLTDQPQQD